MVMTLHFGEKKIDKKWNQIQVNGYSQSWVTSPVTRSQNLVCSAESVIEIDVI